MKRKILIVYNPNSGIGIPARIIKKFYERLLEENIQADLVFTKRPHHATEIVKEAKDYDIIYAIGGDGTLNEVVAGDLARKEKLPVCPFPTGSCNDVAKMLGFKKDLLKNLDLALAGDIKKIDIGTVNDTPFTYVIGGGKFLNIPYETSRLKKSTSGYLAYIKEGIKEFFSDIKTQSAKVIADGVELQDEYSMIMVTNTNHLAGVSNFYKDIELDDGKLEVFLCKSNNQLDLVNNFISFYLGGHPKNITTLKASEISIFLKESPNKNWCIDGEEYQNLKKEYYIKANNKIEFIVPKEKQKKLFKKENV